MENYAPTPDCHAVCDTFDSIAERSRGRSPNETANLLGAAGLIGMLTPHDKSGSGFSLRDALEVMRAAGTRHFSFPLTEAILAAKALAEHDHPLAAALLAGRDIATVAWRGVLKESRNGNERFLTGHVSHAPSANSAHWLLANAESAAHPAGRAIAVIDLTRPKVTVTEGDGFDIDRPYAEIEVAGLMVNDGDFLRFGEANENAFVQAARILRAAEMLGAAEASFAAGKERAVTRLQFGKPLAFHQSVRHQLARDHLGLTGLALSIAHAAVAWAETPGEIADTACDVACASAAALCPSVVENAIQLHGALGFTWDLPLHRSLRRVRKLAQLRDAVSARNALAQRLWPSSSFEEFL